MNINVKVVKLDPNLPLPAYQTAGSAGCDVHSAKDVEIQPGQKALVPTGLKLEIPEGFECQIRPRSSLALKHGVVVFNTPSTIDADYRGEISVLLINTSTVPFSIKKGDRIAQLVFAPVTVASFVEVKELSDTARGAGGWGSTGRS
jgi:dUTP pyrophosphatase